MGNLRRSWLKFLSEDDVIKIDEASRRVISEVGVRLEDTELTEKLITSSKLETWPQSPELTISLTIANSAFQIERYRLW